MSLHLLTHCRRQFMLGQLAQGGGIQSQRDYGAVSKHKKRKAQVKFLESHTFFSVHFLNLLQDEAPIFRKSFAA